MSDALIQIVDENNQPTRAATKQEAWDEGLIHQVVRIMIDDGQGNLLLQQRGLTKDLFPGRWDNSCAGHVDAGETYEQAAIRELEEELGLTGVKLRACGDYFVDETWSGKRLKRFTRTYQLTILADQVFNLPADEVKAVRWWPLAEVKELVKDPDQISDGLRQVITQYYL